MQDRVISVEDASSTEGMSSEARDDLQMSMDYNLSIVKTRVEERAASLGTIMLVGSKSPSF